VTNGDADRLGGGERGARPLESRGGQWKLVARQQVAVRHGVPSQLARSVCSDEGDARSAVVEGEAGGDDDRRARGRWLPGGVRPASSASARGMWEETRSLASSQIRCILAVGREFNGPQLPTGCERIDTRPREGGGG